MPTTSSTAKLTTHEGLKMAARIILDTHIPGRRESSENIIDQSQDGSSIHVEYRWAFAVAVGISVHFYPTDGYGNMKPTITINVAGFNDTPQRFSSVVALSKQVHALALYLSTVLEEETFVAG